MGLLAAKSTNSTSKLTREPMKYHGSLDQYRQFQVTPVLGTEFTELQVADLLSDSEKLRDLAVLTSQRGVLFFRNQKLTPEQQKFLTNELGRLTGKPETSTLHKHPIYSEQDGAPVDGNGNRDPNVLPITSEVTRKLFSEWWTEIPPLASKTWHSDIAYEKVPTDYSTLYAIKTPEDGSGGDTIWASCYEAYDKLSLPMREFLDGIHAMHDIRSTIKSVQARGHKPADKTGAPENINTDYKTVHPIIRTNPVTGWKCIFGVGGSLMNGGLEGVTKEESDILCQYLFRLHVENHDLQARLRWGQNDLALWDNRCCIHTGTNDYKGKRQANLVMGLGEAPYFDPSSKSRREALVKDSLSATQ
ncbi:unnamed protein product [Clonostachys chloroleuca]|uniref:TauD/TfdA-like domain-containing protein n=1 Tax=Clonostachys chloroleuca TaxID=1926264 RepID=A0AA35LWA9_9HYPO|nr:unnamed protein product [Clonostachys chloroleuca]